MAETTPRLAWDAGSRISFILAESRAGAWGELAARQATEARPESTERASEWWGRQERSLMTLSGWRLTAFPSAKCPLPRSALVPAGALPNEANEEVFSELMKERCFFFLFFLSLMLLPLSSVAADTWVQLCLASLEIESGGGDPSIFWPPKN